MFIFVYLGRIIVVNNENTEAYFQIYDTYRQFARNHDAV